MGLIRQFIEIETQFDGIHNWQSCPIEEVSYLKNPHRHIIIVKVRINTSKDRQIEFYMFKKDVDDLIDRLFGRDRVKKLNQKSMETIALMIAKGLLPKYPHHLIVSCSEDGQGTGIVEYDPYRENVLSKIKKFI